MKNTYYVATKALQGLERGKLYFEGTDKAVTLGSGERVSSFPLILKGVLKPIPHYEGNLKEEWAPEKTKILVEVSDGMSCEKMVVKLIEVHKIKKKSLVCLVNIPGVKGNVQLDIPHLYIV